MTSLYDKAYEWSGSIAVGFIFISFLIPLFWGSDAAGATSCFTTVAAYLCAVMVMHKKLKDQPHRTPLLIVLFFCVSVVLCINFGWITYRCAPIELKSISEGERKIEAIYYSVVTFTTLGYGDLYPKSSFGRLFASIIALTGVTHAVAFVGLLIERVSNDQK